MSVEGDDAPRSYTSARGVRRLAERLSARDLTILHQVAELRLMSARQVQLLHFPADEHENESAATRSRQRVLARLIRDRLLIALERRIGGVRAGSAGLIVALGPLGQRVIGAHGPRRRVHEPGLRFVDHTLAIAQLVVDVLVAERTGQLDVLACEAEPASWREFLALGGRHLLRPDAFLALGAGAYELRWFCEVDRATESLPTLLRKCRVYADYYQSGREQTQSGVFPRVCWIVPDEARAERVRSAIADAALPAGLFKVTTSDAAVSMLCEVTR